MRIIHLSDPHFGTDPDAVRDALVQAIHAAKADLIIVSGDLTQRAHSSQFTAAKQFFSALQLPWLTVPGNHDIALWNLWHRIVRPYTSFRRLVGKETECIWQDEDISVHGFCFAKPWRHKDGELLSFAIDAKLKAENLRDFNICFFHHPLDCRRKQDKKNIIRRGEVITQVLADKNVDLVLGGHIHDPFVTTSERRYPDVGYKMIIAFAGTCLSNRTRFGAPNSFNLIDIPETSRVIIHRIDYAEQEDAFIERQQDLFVKNSDTGWMHQESSRSLWV